MDDHGAMGVQMEKTLDKAERFHQDERLHRASFGMYGNLHRYGTAASTGAWRFTRYGWAQFIPMESHCDFIFIESTWTDFISSTSRRSRSYSPSRSIAIELHRGRADRYTEKRGNISFQADGASLPTLHESSRGGQSPHRVPSLGLHEAASMQSRAWKFQQHVFQPQRCWLVRESQIRKQYMDSAFPWAKPLAVKWFPAFVNHTHIRRCSTQPTDTDIENVQKRTKVQSFNIHATSYTDLRFHCKIHKIIEVRVVVSVYRYEFCWAIVDAACKKVDAWTCTI